LVTCMGNFAIVEQGVCAVTEGAADSVIISVLNSKLETLSAIDTEIVCPFFLAVDFREGTTGHNDFTSTSVCQLPTGLSRIQIGGEIDLKQRVPLLTVDGRLKGNS